jgi:hypothetical protein
MSDIGNFKEYQIAEILSTGRRKRREDLPQRNEEQRAQRRKEGALLFKFS